MKTSSYLQSVFKQFNYYQMLGQKTFDQLTDEQLFWQYNEESNSIAIIVKHMWGNMMSRWTDFRTADGEKTWRNREAEFIADFDTREVMQQKWDEGWQCLFNAIEPLKSEEIEDLIYIRNQGHTIVEAINRQLAHYSYHVGQIVFLGKMIQNDQWESLSIPRGQSKAYNAQKFAQEKKRTHFTDELLEEE